MAMSEKVTPEQGEPVTPVRGEVRLSEKRSSLSADRRSAIMAALASTIGCEPEAVREPEGAAASLARVRRSSRSPMLAALLGRRRRSPLPGGAGGMVIELLLQPESAQRLQELVQANSPQLGLLKVQRVTLESQSGMTKVWNLAEGRYCLAPTPPAAPDPVEPTPVKLFQPLVVAVMIGCIIWAVIALLHLMVPTWRGTYLLLGCVLAAVEAGYSQQLLRKRRRFFDDVIKFRAVELLTLLILIKIGGFIGESWSAVWAEIQRWPHEPFTMIDLETLAAFVMALLSWMAASGTAGELARLGEPPEYSRHYVSPLDSLGQRFFWGGGLLVVIAGITLLGRTLSGNASLSMLSLLRRVPDSPSAGFALSILIYFGLGLVMLGQVRFFLLRSSWENQEIPIDKRLPGRWRWASIALIAGAVILALLIPNSYAATTKVLELAGIALAWVLAILFYLGGLLVFAFTWLVNLILAPLFRPSDARPEQDAPPSFEPPIIPPRTPGVTPEWVLLARSFLFWALIAAGVFYVIRTYLRDHPEMGAWLLQFRPVRALRRLWEALRAWVLRLKNSVQILLPRPRVRRPSELPVGSGRSRFFRLGALSARERIVYYYLSILRRAERLGYARRRQDTPHEYYDTLKPHLDEGDREMQELTSAFLEARYSEHPVSVRQDQEVRADWQHVKEALRALRRKKPAGDPDA